MSTTEQLMTTPAVTATSDEALTSVIRRMHDRRVGSVIVVDGRRVAGIVTERDVLRMTADARDDATAGEAMSSPADVIEMSTEPSAALAQMRERGYRHTCR